MKGVSPYLVTSIIRRGTRERVQDIVSANGDIGNARPLASTTESTSNVDSPKTGLPMVSCFLSSKETTGDLRYSQYRGCETNTDRKIIKDTIKSSPAWKK
jgi:hypothetical protein